ncbi:MAG: methyltransferase domain-containing protein [Patescibacteria group bacterium]|nr:methyltransferase domain-containing protein [Patescibacteria group bacterium]
MLQTQKQNQDEPYKISLPKFDISVFGAGKKIGSDPGTILETAGVSEGEMVADFGCGVGFFVMEIAKIVGNTGRVFAIDISREILDSLKAKAIDSGRRNIYGILADLEKPGATGLEDESVDVVLMINFLYLIKNKEVVLKEAYRILKKNGKLVIMDWSEGGQHNMIEKEQIVGAKEIRDLTRKLGLRKLKTFEAGLAHEVNVFRKE